MVFIRPEPENEEVEAGSRPTAIMTLYRNPDYTDPFTMEEEVVLSVGSALFVGVSSPEAVFDNLAVILENCYATPTADPADPTQFTLIQDRSVPGNHQQVCF